MPTSTPILRLASGLLGWRKTPVLGRCVAFALCCCLTSAALVSVQMPNSAHFQVRVTLLETGLRTTLQYRASEADVTFHLAV